MLNDKTILITGGTGSFGKKMTHIILTNYKPRKLIIFSRDELKQFEMSQRWSTSKYPCLKYTIGDVRDKSSLMRAFHGVDYVIHAAALKQVPAAEHNPEEFIKTNVIGAMNIIDAALENNVHKVIALSTDKACNPINLYGATKLCSDKLFVAANVYSSLKPKVFSVVRYGNVVGSRGSVVPFFQERAHTGLIPITDTRMTRFWITLDQGVHFVLKALEGATGGEIFVPKLPSMKVTDLAKAIAPECKHEIVGIRPGEKIHELLIGRDDSRNTLEFENFYVILPQYLYNDKSNGYKSLGKTVNDFEYNSGTNKWFMSIDELRAMLTDIADDYSIEKSRWSMDEIPK
ncbi:MAG: UDP-N-acetylglucosamine 4,6-dehydratase (inverting) [Thermodesulfobacteriota bacterium]